MYVVYFGLWMLFFTWNWYFSHVASFLEPAQHFCLQYSKLGGMEPAQHLLAVQEAGWDLGGYIAVWILTCKPHLIADKMTRVLIGVVHKLFLCIVCYMVCSFVGKQPCKKGTSYFPIEPVDYETRVFCSLLPLTSPHHFCTLSFSLHN